MKTIGGYFELELNPGREYHHRALRINLGRTALEYILRARRVKKVFLPYYTCEAVLDPVKRLGLELEFYRIDGNFEPLIGHRKPKKNEYFLYTNYFGLKDEYIKKLAKTVPNLVIDNAQAFYCLPEKGIDTFYSPRKFFGVPDGAYLYTDAKLPGRLKKDVSAGRFGHLIGRLERGAETSYGLFKDNERSLNGQPIMRMSNITERLLQILDYKKVARIRRENFLFLHRQLNKTNRLELGLDAGAVPMVYPYLTDKPGLREKLAGNKIYVARYWPDVLKWSERKSLEYRLANELLALPVDQRYGKEDLMKISKIIGGR